MRRALALAAVLVTRAAAAQEVPVHLLSDADPALGAQITLELRALGHAVDVSGPARADAAQVALRSESDAVVVTIVVPDRGRRALRLRRGDDAQRGTDALRVVETLRALLLAVEPVPPPAAPPPRVSPPPPPPAPPPPPWHDALHVSVGAGALVSPGGSSPQPTASVRLAWEGPLWIEALGRVSLDAGRFEGGAALQTHFAVVGVGAPITRGSLGALGVTLRAGVAWAQATGDLAREGAVGVVEGALGARLRVWRRLALVGSLAVGSALGGVQVQVAGRALGEWGRPYLDATIGLSY